MKRLLLFTLIFAVLLSTAGCAHSSIVDPVSFYYPHKTFTYAAPDDVIAPEIREGSQIANIQQLLNAYLEGPKDLTLVFPFPKGTRLVDTAKIDDVRIITLSDDLAVLSGVNLTLACCCLAKTVMAYSGEDSVQIQLESALLDGESSIVISADTVILFDTITPQSAD